MQERYLGDSHDFIKYAFLRSLSQSTGMRIGLNWYLTQPEDVDHPDNNDGEKRHHLKGLEWQKWDIELLEKLRRFEDRGARRIERIAEWGVLPTDAMYFEEVVPVDGRSQWHERGKLALNNSDVVFIDPDNGYEVASMAKRKAPKYSLYSEAADWYRAGKAVVGIQFARQCDPIKRAHEVRGKLHDAVGEADVLPVIRGRVAPNILFVTIAPPLLVVQLDTAIRTFVETGPKVELIE